MSGDDTPVVIIAGGGIAGLATAYFLRRGAAEQGRPIAIRLFERDSRIGGKVVTVRQDGFVIEGGPDSFLTTKPWAVELCRELGLGDRLIPANPERRPTYVLAGGRLRVLPDGLHLVAPTRWGPFLRSDLFSWRGKLRLGLEPFIPARRAEADESVGAFVRRRLGAEAVARLGEPLLAGIYAAEVDRLSLAATFPQLAELERRHGSLIKGLRAARSTPPPAAAGAPFVSLAGGTAELVEALGRSLGPIVRAGCGVAAVERVGGGYGVGLADGSRLRADALVLATPAPVSAELLAGPAPAVARAAGAIRHVSTATVSLAYRRDELPQPLDGTGFVVARGEPVRLLGCTWSSNKLAGRAPEGAVLLRVFLGGPGREDDVAADDAALVERARADLKRVLGVAAAPRLARVFRWMRANPQYDVGHLERVAALEAACPPGLHLVGAAYRGVGVPDCVRASELTAERLLQAMEKPPG
jgi:oxygen-dependent protoporphyrinogen oxidase